MDDRERHQVTLIIDHELQHFRASVESRINSVFADHSARGRLHSGATVRVSVRAMGELTESLLGGLRLKVHGVAADEEAFLALSEAVQDGLDFCEKQMVPVTKMASGRLQGPLNSSFSSAAGEIFGEMSANIKAQLEITRFDFETPPKQPRVAFETSITAPSRRPRCPNSIRTPFATC